MAATSPIQNHPRASLLGLPGELRNRIYRLVLVTPSREDHIVVNPHQHDQPALLKTSRQIRKDNISIFECENIFDIEVVDLSPSLPQNHHWLHRRHCLAAYKLMSPGRNVWKNLKAWLAAYFHGEVRGLGSSGTNSTHRSDMRVFARVFLMQTVLCQTDPTIQWEVMEVALEAWKATVDIMDPSFWHVEQEDV